jgi:hypothetical protein
MREVTLQTDPTFDDFIYDAGGCGRFQKFVFIGLLLICMTPQFMLMNMSFF